MPAMTDEEKLAIIATHAKTERAKDWDAALATMIDEPSYEYFPYRLRVSGEQAIRTMWERTLILPCLNYDTGRKVLGMERYVNEQSVVDMVQSTFVDETTGEQIYSTFLCIFHFDDDKIIRESIFLDNTMLPYFDQVFSDPEFLGLPGVEQF